MKVLPIRRAAGGVIPVAKTRLQHLRDPKRVGSNVFDNATMNKPHPRNGKRRRVCIQRRRKDWANAARHNATRHNAPRRYDSHAR